MLGERQGHFGGGQQGLQERPAQLFQLGQAVGPEPRMAFLLARLHLLGHAVVIAKGVRCGKPAGLLGLGPEREDEEREEEQGRAGGLHCSRA